MYNLKYRPASFLPAFRFWNLLVLNIMKFRVLPNPGKEAGITALTGNQKNIWVSVLPPIHLTEPAANGIFPTMRFILSP